MHLRTGLGCAPWVALLLACNGSAQGTSETSDTDASSASASTSMSSSPAESSSTTSTSTSTTWEPTPCQRNDECEPGFSCETGDCIFDTNLCGEGEVIERPARIVLLIDKSAAMAELWDDDVDPDTPPLTRWSSLHAAVEATLVEFAGEIDFGLALAPSAAATSSLDASACLVEAALEVPASADLDAVLSALPGADAGDEALRGASPFRVAFEGAASHLESLDADRRPYILFVGTNPANCDPAAVDDAARLDLYDPGFVDAIASAAAAGVATFVVGLDRSYVPTPITPDLVVDGVNIFDPLRDAALAGGVPRPDPEVPFYDARSATELDAALHDAAAWARCTLGLDPAPHYWNFVVLKVDGGDELASTDCAGGEGWTRVDDEIVLCGALCAAYRAGATIEVVYRCPNGDAAPGSSGS